MKITNTTPPYKPVLDEEKPATPDPEHQQSVQFPEDYKAKPEPSIGKVVGSNLDSPMNQHNQVPYQQEDQESDNLQPDPDSSPSKERRDVVEIDPLIGYVMVFSEDGMIPKLPNNDNVLMISIEDWEAGKKEDLVSAFLSNREQKVCSEQPVHSMDSVRHEYLVERLKKIDKKWHFQIFYKLATY